MTERKTRSLQPARTMRGLRRREAILDAASEEFLTKGYEGASLRRIMAAAGGSSRTLYQHFSDKAGLFRAIVDRLGSRVAEISIPDISNGRSFEEDLQEVGVAYLTAFLQPEPLAFLRMMVAESVTSPEIALMVWSSTYKPFAARLAQYLRDKSYQEGFKFKDPELTAVQFLEAIKSALQLDIIFGGAYPKRRELARRVKIAVDIFLNGGRSNSIRKRQFNNPNSLKNQKNENFTDRDR